VTDIATLGYEVDSTQLERGTRALDANAKAAERTAAAAEKVGTSYQSVSRASAPVDALANAHVRLKDAYDRENGVRTRMAAYLNTERGMRLAQVQALNGQAKAMDATAVSAGQLSAALRGVPAQFTDIVTALQGGQSPMQVLFQQGGQLKDQFGGIGAAARGLAGYVMGLVNPLTVTAAAVGTLGYIAYTEAERMERFGLAVIKAGQNAAHSAAGLDALTERLDRLEGITRGGADEAVLALTENTRLSGEQFDRAAAAIARWSSVSGESADEVSRRFAELGKDPYEALLKLAEGGGMVTKQMLDAAQSLQESGDKAGAARIAFNALVDDTNNKSAQAVANLSGWARVWREIKDEAAGAWAAVAGATAAMAERGNVRMPDNSPNFGGDVAAAARWRQQQREREMVEGAMAASIARNRAAVNAAMAEARRELDTLNSSNGYRKDGKAGIDAEIERIQRLGKAANASQAEIRAMVAAARAAEPKAAAPKKTDEQREADQLQRSYESLAGQMTRQIALYGKVGEAAKVSYDVQYGALKGLSQARKDELIRQAQQIDDQRIEAQFQSQVATLEREIALFGERGRAAALAYDMQAAGLDKVNPKLAESLRELAAWRDWQDEMAAIEDVWDDVAAEHGRVALKVKDDLDFMTTAAQQAGRNMQDAFADFLFDPFKDGAEGMLENFGKVLQRMAAEMAASQVFKMLGNWGQTNAGAGGWQGALAGIVSGLFGAPTKNALGGVYSSPSLSAYSGQIVNKPTMFAFAKGAGLMGEAGPEAIMPLRRGPDGRLGVSAAAGGGIKVEVNNYGSPDRVSVREESQQMPNGDVMKKLVIDLLRDDIASGGGTDALLRGRYGLRPVV